MRKSKRKRNDEELCTRLFLDGDVVVGLRVRLQTHGAGLLGGCCRCAQYQLLLGRLASPPSAPEAAVEVLVALELG